MRKFQEWHDNQTYFMHLTNLTLIRFRKPPSTVHLKKRQNKQNRSLSQQQIDKANKRMVKRIENPKRIAIVSNSDYFKPSFSKEKYRMYQKNLNYENFLFGKRILQAEPVISASKMEKEYEVRKLNKVSRSSNNTSWSVRSNRLKQFLKSEEPSIYLKGYGKHALKLKIHDYEFHKLKLQDDDMHHISIIAQFGKSIRNSDLVPIKEMAGHQFCFRFSKKIAFNGSVRAYLRYHNGIQDTQLGYFDFSIKYYLEGESPPPEEEAEIYKRVGTHTGRIVFSTSTSKILQLL